MISFSLHTNTHEQHIVAVAVATFTHCMVVFLIVYMFVYVSWCVLAVVIPKIDGTWHIVFDRTHNSTKRLDIFEIRIDRGVAFYFA